MTHNASIFLYLFKAQNKLEFHGKKTQSKINTTLMKRMRMCLN